MPAATALNITVLTGNAAGGLAIALDTFLQERGHTVAVVDEGVFTSTVAEFDDVILCVEVTDPPPVSPQDVVANLNTHMGTHGVPVVVLSDPLVGGVLSQTGLASALGLAANLIGVTPGTGAVVPAGRAQLPMDGWPVASPLILSANTNLNALPSANTLCAGIKLTTDASGFVSGCLAELGDDRIPSVGGTFPTRAAWFGSYGTDRALDSMVITATLAEYCAGSYDGVGF